MSRQLPTMAGMAPSDISIASLNFASLSSPFSLANSCTFLIGVWRITRNLAQSALATVPGRRRKVLFLVRLKNRRIFSLYFLCLNYNAYDSGGIFFFKESEETWNFCKVPRLANGEGSPLRRPYIKGEIWQSSLYTEFKERMSSKMNFTPFPREPLVSKSALLHKGVIKCAFRISKRFALSPKKKH